MTNLAASLRARLLNTARSAGVTLPSLIERFAMGRLLWRLSHSAEADRFVLKGAQLFSLWMESPHRPTRDLDLLSRGDASLETVRDFFSALLTPPADPEDALIWGEVNVALIREDQRYQGVRISTTATLSGAVVPVQVDIGFGDAISPAPVELSWRELLDFPAARLLTYPPETVIAEKLDAAVDLGRDNSRMKDFFDLDWLCRHMEFDFAVLHAAVRATFARRGTALPEDVPFALSGEFAADAAKVTQWNAFLRKSRLTADPLAVVIARLHDFLMPVLNTTKDHMHWKPGSGWRAKRQ